MEASLFIFGGRLRGKDPNRTVREGGADIVELLPKGEAKHFDFFVPKTNVLWVFCVTF